MCPDRTSRDPNADFDDYASTAFVVPRVTKAHSVLHDALEQEYPGKCYTHALQECKVNARHWFEDVAEHLRRIP